MNFINWHVFFVETGLREGISYISKRFSKANNKDMKNNDFAKPSKYVIYLDEHNLYGQPMSRYLPYGWFKRLK